MNKTDVLSIVYEALGVVNDMRSAADQLPYEADVLLWGEGGALDSLSLVTLVLSIEERVSGAVGRTVVLYESDLVAEAHRLRTPDAIADFVVEYLAR